MSKDGKAIDANTHIIHGLIEDIRLLLDEVKDLKIRVNDIGGFVREQKMRIDKVNHNIKSLRVINEHNLKDIEMRVDKIKQELAELKVIHELDIKDIYLRLGDEAKATND